MDRMTLTIDIQTNQIGLKRINLRSSLVVANLIATIKDKFNLDGDFEIRLENADGPLPSQSILSDAGVTDQCVLVCSRVTENSGTPEAIQRGARGALSRRFKRVYLQEERMLGEFDLAWQPAIIGRKNHRDPAKNKLLAVDLDDLDDSLTVSRHHACITEKEGAFFIESLNPNNPTYLNDRLLGTGMKHPLPAGSRIRVGQLMLSFYIIS
jgi:hypothetical protein